MKFETHDENHLRKRICGAYVPKKDAICINFTKFKEDKCCGSHTGFHTYEGTETHANNLSTTRNGVTKHTGTLKNIKGKWWLVVRKCEKCNNPSLSRGTKCLDHIDTQKKPMKRERSPVSEKDESSSEMNSDAVPAKKRVEIMLRARIMSLETNVKGLEDQVKGLEQQVKILHSTLDNSIGAYDANNRRAGHITHSLYNLHNASKRQEDGMDSVGRKLRRIEDDQEEILKLLRDQSTQKISTELIQFIQAQRFQTSGSFQPPNNTQQIGYQRYSPSKKF